MATDSGSSSVGSNEVDARELPGSLSPDIDDIDSQLSRITISRDELRESLCVVIPRGYTLASALSPKEHFDRLLLKYRRHWQQQNVEGLMAVTLLGQKRKNYGFRPEEVVSSGSIETSSCRSSNLRCPIHAIFQLKNFDECPDYIYDEFKPALRLASLFITAPALISYWVTLAYGERILDVELAVRSGHATYRIVHPVPPTSDKAAQVQGFFLKLAQHIHFSFRRRADREDSDGCWGSEHQAPSQDIGHPWTTESSVRLNTDFFVVAKRYSQLPFHDEASRLRFNLFFAVNICHEIAHAFERRTRAAHIIRARQNVGQTYDAFEMSEHVETHLYKNQQAEAGTAWEFYLFGGKIQTFNQRCDCSHGLYTWSLDPANNLVGDIMMFSVPMAYVEEIQQMSTWIKAQELQQRDFLFIPKTGAQSYSSVACATMALRQYIKTKEEEAAAAEEEEEEEEEEDSSAEKRPLKKSKHNLSTTPKVAAILQGSTESSVERASLVKESASPENAARATNTNNVRKRSTSSGDSTADPPVETKKRKISSTAELSLLSKVIRGIPKEAQSPAGAAIASNQDWSDNIKPAISGSGSTRVDESSKTPGGAAAIINDKTAITNNVGKDEHVLRAGVADGTDPRADCSRPPVEPSEDTRGDEKTWKPSAGEFSPASGDVGRV